MTGPTTRPVIERLTIRNYRVLRDVTFDNLTPLTVLFGPNGSGKSTVFDVFAFLHEAFTTNLRRAWDRRNRMGEIRSRGSHGGVEFELKYREKKTSRLVTYRLVIDEADGYAPSPAPIIGIEEPENQLHPRLLPLLAEEARSAAGRSQLLVTTHSPYFVDALRPHELWLLYCADDGYARCLRASEVPAVSAMMAEGAQLGSLWMEGYFGAGDPLTQKLAL